jgi:phosphopantothenoylcysteine decarboxylase/phosphopantothenate--cysteine ligase
VAGGIAAYKACELLRRLTETGHSVRVLPTASALRFVGAATFEALSGQPVHTGVFADVPAVPHVKLGQEADLVVVAPATADLMARAAHGRADDLLTAALLTARCPVLLRRRCTPRCGSTPPRATTWPCCAPAARSCSNPPPGA